MLSLRGIDTRALAHGRGGLPFFRRSPVQVRQRRGSTALLFPTGHLPVPGSSPSRHISSACCIAGESLLEGSPVGVAERGYDGLRSPEMVEREYADLKLKEKLGRLGCVRIRQHVNPLSSAFSVPASAPDWKEAFEDPQLPLMVDIGSGSGRFLIWLAKNSREPKNYLGLEIRNKLVKRAQFWVQDLGLRNIYFMFANANVSFDQVVTAYPGPLVFVSILCPDPYFKKRHHKRRVLQKPLVESILRNLNPGGQVFLQSDVLDVALDMREQFDIMPDLFQHVDGRDCGVSCDADGWLLNNPMGIRTEREIHAEFEGAKVYRRVYQKTYGFPCQ